MLMPSMTISDQSVALDSDAFEEIRNDRKSLASRLRAVSLFVETQNKRVSVTVSVTCELRCHERLASSAGVGKRAKGESETALVSYNDLDATLIGRINDTSALF